MVLNLTKLSLEELLRKFATGGHKPGSGRAATVIGLSNKREAFREVLANLDSIEASIADDLEPALLAAFDEDSDQFHKVITARRARDGERDPSQRWKHARRALNELYGASGIALDIAEKCLLVAEHAITVFDIGFKAARGDSEVAIDSALSGATGAISIVYLNLSSFKGNARAIELLRHVQELEDRADRLKKELQIRILKLKSAAEEKNDRFALDLNSGSATDRI
jgi:formiminotetrahydrofolate cyclodeaminase